MRFACFLAAPLCVAFVVGVGVGCGGRTEGFNDFPDYDAVPADSSNDDVSFDSGRDDVIGIDVIRDGISDVIRLDSDRTDTATDTGPDVIGIDVIRIDTGPDVIGFDTSTDSGVLDTGTIDSGIDSGTDSIVIDSGVDTGFDTGFDTGSDTGSDTDGGPVDGGILCGATRCDATSEDCCVSFGGVPSCVTKGTCGGIPISCSSGASCPTGDVCCFEFGGGFGSATCVPLFCPGIQLCGSDAECRLGQHCLPIIAGYRSCR